jgi:hypothetical protein
MAGTAVTTTFILSLNHHFFEYREATSLRQLLQLIKNGPPMLNEFDSFAPPPINASLTPGQWMRMQDFDTAKEVMRLAKPGADSFIVRVFAPLVVVLPGADRTDIDGEEAWTTAFRSFAVHHFYPVAVAVVFIVAFVAVLMNFLLYTDHEDEPLGNDNEGDAVRVETVALPHKLDIIKMVSSHKGGLVTVALDRTIAVTTFDRSQQQTQRIMCLSNEALAMIHWPIYSIAVDDSCEWLACHCANEQILLYSCARAAFVEEPLPYPDDNPPILFKFVRLPSTEGSQLHFMVLTSGGRFTSRNIDADTTKTLRLEASSMLGAAIQEMSSQGRRLVVATDQAQITCYSWTNGEWVSGLSQTLPIPTLYGRITGAVRIQQAHDLSGDICVVTTSRHVIFLDSQTLAAVNHFSIDEGDRPIAEIMLGQASRCSHCASPAVRGLALVSEGTNNSGCLVTTLSPRSGDDGVFCIKRGDPTCESFVDAVRTKHTLQNSGAWSLVSSQAILGLRKQVQQQANGVKPPVPLSMRKRRMKRSLEQAATHDDVWEAYKFSLDGEMDTVSMSMNGSNASEDSGALYVNDPGPAVTLDSQTVAVAFGNVVKILKSSRRGSLRRSTGRTLGRDAQVFNEPRKPHQT